MAPTVNHDFRGILPAIVTPFDSSGDFAEPVFARLVERLYAAGVHGLYVCGQTGEGMQQPAGQRKRVAEAAIRLSPPGKTVVIHVGAHSTREAVDLARHASAAGAAAVSALPPGPAYSFPEIHDYYSALAEASAVPLLIYYFPALAPNLKSLDQFLELCEIPNVAGLKFTDSDFFKMGEIRRRGPRIFSGCDEMLAAGLLMGADGGIGSIYNLIPEEFLRIYNLAGEGRWEEARRVQRDVNELIEVLLRFPIHPVVKTLLAWSGVDCGGCVSPKRSLTAAQCEELRARLERTRLGREKWIAVEARP